MSSNQGTPDDARKAKKIKNMFKYESLGAIHTDMGDSPRNNNIILKPNHDISCVRKEKKPPKSKAA